MQQPTFPEILRTERKKRGWSQKELAEEIKVALDTVSRWERGEIKPNNFGVKQLCAVFKMTRAELGLDTLNNNEESLLNVPPRGSYYVGREELIEKIHRGFKPFKTEKPFYVQALHGLQGIGKTAIAAAYVRYYSHQYQTVIWIDASSEESIHSDLLAIAVKLQLPEKDTADQNIAIAAVKRWLKEQRNWLLVFDNVTDAKLIHDFLPHDTRTNGHILITTYLPSVEQVHRLIPVEKMTKEDGKKLLLSRSRITEKPLSAADQQVVEDILDILDGLPLAIEQASAYIHENQCGFSGYLELYHTQHEELLRRGTPINYPATIATTWSLSFKRIEETNPVAAELLRFLSFLYPDSIPDEIFTEGVSRLEGSFAETAAKELSLNDALSAILQYSLIQRMPEEKTLRIHRLVQTVIKDTMDNATQQRLMKFVVQAVNQTFLDTDFSNWQHCQRCLPLAQICAELIEDQHMTFIEATHLLEQTARYLLARSQYDQAERLLIQSLALQNDGQNAESASRASTLTCLAKLRYKQGKFAQAELLFMEAGAVMEQLQEGKGINEAENLTGLGLVYYNQGRYQEAMDTYRQALKIWEKTVNYEHPEAAMTFNNLAWLYYNQGDYNEVAENYQRAIEIWERTRGNAYPDIATSYNGLAMLYRSLGNYQEATLYFGKALKIRVDALGDEDPDVATTLNDIAWLLRVQGKYEQAEEHYERVSAIRIRLLGEQHPQTFTMHNDRAILTMDLGKYNDAEPDLLKTYEFRRSKRGPLHPQVATSCINLGWLYFNMGLYSQAESYHNQAFKIRQKVLGKNHPHTARSWNALGAIARVQGDYSEAEKCYKEALRICEETVRKESPLHTTFLNNQALLYVDQGKYRQALKGYTHAYRIRKKLLGEEHPRVATTLCNIASLYVLWGQYDPHIQETKYKEAEQYYIQSLRMLRQVFEESHPEIAQNLYGLAELYLLQGRNDAARKNFTEALRIRKNALKPEHPAIAQSLDGLAMFYHAQKRYDEAESRYLMALDMREKALGPEHPDVAQSLHNLALLYTEQGRGKEYQAEQHFIRALMIKEKVMGVCHPSVLETRKKLGSLYQQMGRSEKANDCFLHVRECQEMVHEQEDEI